MAFSCNSQKKASKNDCSLFNDKFHKFQMNGVKDSVLFYINKAIECDPKEQFFRLEKAKYYIVNNQLEQASMVIKGMDLENEPSLKLMDIVIDLKLQRISAITELKSIYLQYSKDEIGPEESNIFIYKIALINYFEGKTEALKVLNKAKDNNEIKGLIDFIELNIKNKTKKDVLYTLFNIN